MFFKINLRSRYHQLKIKSSDISKSAFRTWNDHYKFIMMTFEVTNTRTIFMNLMNVVFQ